MELHFEKWHGLKNDFIVTRVSDADGKVLVDSLGRSAPWLCQRDGTGIGADGLLVLQGTSRDAVLPHSLIIFNRDGSRAKNCGNGLRCAALSVYRYALHQKRFAERLEGLELNVEGRSFTCQFMTSHSDTLPFVAVDMGIVALNQANSWHDFAVKAVKDCAAQYNLSTQIRDVASCDIGNLHIVIRVDQATEEWMHIFGRELQNSPHWDGINVHLVSEVDLDPKDQTLARAHLQGGTIDSKYFAFPWERGVGPTHACGSGASAVGAYGFGTGLIDRSAWIAVDMPGGRLYVQQTAEDDPLILAGPANFVFTGIIDV
jgi:diaminopimelate epimerase